MLDLHKQTLALVHEERRLTGQIIANLQKIQDQNLHLKMGYSSLFDYCTRALGYAEACAYRRIAAVKVVRIAPEITEKLDAGTLNLTNVAMAQTFFTNAYRKHAALSTKTKKQILESLENCSKRETEDKLTQVAEKLGLSAADVGPQEKLRALSPDEAVLHVRLKKSTVEKLHKLKNLRSHKNPNMSYADLIEDLCDFTLSKIDPTQTKPAKETAPSQNLRHVPTHLRQVVWRRDRGQCTYTHYDPTTDTKRRCESRHLLQIDHIQPLAAGGDTTAQNLRLLCHAHHRLRETKTDEPP